MEYIIDNSIFKMYKKVYWKQIFSLKTSFKIKWTAIKSLWSLRKLTESDSIENKN